MYSIFGGVLKSYWIFSKFTFCFPWPCNMFSWVTVNIMMNYKCTFNLSYYRPQRSCGKVKFSQASVILFTDGGEGVVCLSACWYTPLKHPLGSTHPRSTPTPLGSTHTPVKHTPPRSTPPEAHTSRKHTHPRSTPLGSTPSLEALPRSTPPTVTAADGMHPTGMLSCSFYFHFGHVLLGVISCA